MKAPDLTQRPPRSPRVRLGGYTILPRLLDKARATLAGTNGEYRYNNPNDGHFFRFTGITPEALLARVKTGAGDWDMLLWIQEQAPIPRTALEIQQWSDWTETVAFNDVEMRSGSPNRSNASTPPGRTCAAPSITSISTITSASVDKPDTRIGTQPRINMAGRYLETYFTPGVLAAQQHYFGRAQQLPPQPGRDWLTDEERIFIEARDSFYLASVNEDGWPYVQHRGGSPDSSASSA